MRRLVLSAFVALTGCSLLLDTNDLGGENESPVRQDAGDSGLTDGSIASDAGIDAAPAPITCPEANLSSDPKNCGACAHDCLGGLCSLGKCQPVLFGKASGRGVGVTTDGTTVYVSTLEGAIQSRAIAGGSMNDVRKLPQGGHIELLDNNTLIMADNTAVLRIPLNSSAEPQRLFQCASQCLGIGIDSSGRIYVADRGPEAVLRIESDGGGTKIGEGVFDFVEDLQIVGETIYLASEGTNQIVSFPRTGGNATIFDTLEDVVAVAVDGNEMWAVSQRPGRIVRRPLAQGGVFEVMAQNQSGPAGIVMTPKAVFWANVNNGEVMMLAR